MILYGSSLSVNLAALLTFGAFAALVLNATFGPLAALTFLACAGLLMISNVQYAAVPTVGFRSIRGLLGTALVVGTLAGVILLPKEFFFPALMGYVLFGIARTVLLGLLERLPARDLTGDPGLVDPMAGTGSTVTRRRRRRRRQQRPNQGPQDRTEPRE